MRVLAVLIGLSFILVIGSLSGVLARSIPAWHAGTVPADPYARTYALPPLAPRRAANVTATRPFRPGGTSINGKDMDMDRIDVTVERGSTERWVVDNPQGDPHNFHIHDRQFVIESIDGHPFRS